MKETYGIFKKFAADNDLKFEIKHKKLEVVAIFGSNNIVYEIARLRREEYINSSSHVPSIVSFTECVEEDAKRRDFTINSMYYDRHNSSIIDPLGGMQDLKNRLVKTVLDADKTLAVDPARIIRLVELAARFNLGVENSTLNAAKKYAGNVFNLSKDRLKKELDRLYIDNKYGEDYNEYLKRVNRLFSDLGLKKLISTENWNKL